MKLLRSQTMDDFTPVTHLKKVWGDKTGMKNLTNNCSKQVSIGWIHHCSLVLQYQWKPRPTSYSICAEKKLLWLFLSWKYFISALNLQHYPQGASFPWFAPEQERRGKKTNLKQTQTQRKKQENQLSSPYRISANFSLQYSTDVCHKTL